MYAEGKLSKPTRTCTSASKHAHTLTQSHFPKKNFNFPSVWLGGNRSHVSVCWRRAENIWKQCVWAALCVLGDYSQNYLSNISARWGRESAEHVSPSHKPDFFISLPFWGVGSLEVKWLIGSSTQHPPGLSSFWPAAAVGGVWPLALRCEESPTARPRLHIWNHT